MDAFLRVCAFAMIAVILGLVLSNQRKDIALLLTLTACIMLGTLAISYLNPVFAFFKRLRDIGDLDNVLLSTMLKCVSTGFVGDVTSTVCNDAGNSAMGKLLQVLTTVLILGMSVPLFERLLSLIEEILGRI